jgi:hypothetical protein
MLSGNHRWQPFVRISLAAAALLASSGVAYAEESPNQPQAAATGQPVLFGLGLGLATVGLANLPTGVLVLSGGAEDVGHAMNTHALHDGDERTPIGVGILVGSGVLLAGGTALAILTAPRAGTRSAKALRARTPGIRFEF